MSNQKVEKLLKESLLIHKEIKEEYENSAEFRWKNKVVEESYSLYDGDTINNVTYKDCLKVEISNELKETGSSALKITNSTNVENIIPRPWPSVVITTEQVTEIKRFTRVSFNVYIKATGYENFYIHFSVGNDDNEICHSFSVKPNSWKHVIFELETSFKNISFVKINPWIMGTPPEGLPEYIIYLDRVVLEKVTPDTVFGWKTQSLAYSQIGYLPKSEKLIWTSKNNGDTFYLHKFNNGKDKKIKLKVKELKSSFGKFYCLDFSKIEDIDTYYVEYGDLETNEFEINNDIFSESIVKSINFLRLLRCGVTIDGVHTACHLNCKAVHPENKKMVPVFGGWHDAGDVSQFEIPTAEMAQAILELAERFKDTDYELSERLIEEARVGIDWLLQTRFGDGYRALAVTYNYWRQNVLDPSNDTIYKNIAEYGTFENFLSSAALAQCFLTLNEEESKNYKEYCLRAAKEDYAFAKTGYEEGLYSKRWGPTIDSVTCGAAILAAVRLYQSTNNTRYLIDAVKYADIVMSCQEKNNIGELKPIRGFFYEDPKHNYVLTYEHRGHEQSPIQGIVELMKVLPSHEKYSKWQECVNLYLEYVNKSLEYGNCYNLLPGHVYILDKMNFDRFTIPSSGYGTKEEGQENLIEQIKHGIKLGEGIYLRMLPIAVQRRGFHATLLSKTKAISSIYSLKHDEKVKQIVLNQIEWIFGKNPFSSSTMYGLGYNYHPLYVAFSRQMVGSLPVGIMTKGYDDAPYWPVRDGAVYKEIWGHTTGKYLWILADLLKK